MNQTLDGRPVSYREHSTRARFLVPLVVGFLLVAVAVFMTSLPLPVSAALFLLGAAAAVWAQVAPVRTYSRLRDERAKTHPEERTWREHVSRDYWVASGWRGAGTMILGLGVFASIYGKNVLGVIPDGVTTGAVVLAMLWNPVLLVTRGGSEERPV